MWGLKVDPTLVACLWAGVNAVIVVVLTRIYTNAMRARHKIEYVSPYAFGTLSALADILTPPEARQVEPDDVARNVDAYLTDFTASGKGKIKWALRGMTAYPLLTLRPPFGAMEREQRRDFMEKRFMSEGSWSLGRWWRRNLQLMMGSVLPAGLPRLLQRSGRRCLRWVSALRGPPAGRCSPGSASPNPPPGLDVEELDEGIDALEADIVIVGSGAAGAILAYEMAAQGKSVIVMERGEHVDPSNFSDQETTMLSHLYSDGAIQLYRDLRFAVLQGMCVGGSPVVNNAVCFDLPQETFDRWNDAQTYDAGLNETGLLRIRGACQCIFCRSPNRLRRGSPGAAKAFAAGAATYGPATSCARTSADCFGCGYCNIGCKFGKKLSMLDRRPTSGAAGFPRQGAGHLEVPGAQDPIHRQSCGGGPRQAQGRWQGRDPCKRAHHRLRRGYRVEPAASGQWRRECPGGPVPRLRHGDAADR